MKKPFKYDASGLNEAQFEPGSGKRVLKNLLGIKSKRAMDKIEAAAYMMAIKESAKIYDKGHRFTLKDICKIHKIWLGKIYKWAGQYRNVNVSKGGFQFAAAKYVPQLMADFDKNVLRVATPCRAGSVEEIVAAIAVTHAELVLIHPFREGNGRVARIISILMALQAGLPPLDFGGITGGKRKEYFAAVRAGIGRNYKPMEKVFAAVIRRTLRRYEE